MELAGDRSLKNRWFRLLEVRIRIRNLIRRTPEYHLIHLNIVNGAISSRVGTALERLGLGRSRFNWHAAGIDGNDGIDALRSIKLMCKEPLPKPHR